MSLRNESSRHFQLDQLADGVYAAIYREGGLAASNAGIVDLGDRTLIFDAFFSPQAAADLCAAAEAITDRPVTWVVNSHWHHDHVWGNQAFSAQTDIVATRATRQLIATEGRKLVEEFQRTAATTLASWQAQLQATDDRWQQRQCATWVDYYRACVEAQPILNLRLPSVTFDERLSLHGSKRTAELIACGAGHSQSDAILFLPEDGIVFMGDLLFVGYQPYLGSGDPEHSLDTLKMVGDLDAATFVPGHGPVGQIGDVTVMAQYIQTLKALADQLFESDNSEDAIDSVAIPQPFGDWLYASFLAPNLHFLYQRQLAQRRP